MHHRSTVRLRLSSLTLSLCLCLGVQAQNFPGTPENYDIDAIRTTLAAPAPTNTVTVNPTNPSGFTPSNSGGTWDIATGVWRDTTDADLVPTAGNGCNVQQTAILQSTANAEELAIAIADKCYSTNATPPVYTQQEVLSYTDVAAKAAIGRIGTLTTQTDNLITQIEYKNGTILNNTTSVRNIYLGKIVTEAFFQFSARSVAYYAVTDQGRYPITLVQSAEPAYSDIIATIPPATVVSGITVPVKARFIEIFMTSNSLFRNIRALDFVFAGGGKVIGNPKSLAKLSLPPGLIPANTNFGLDAPGPRWTYVAYLPTLFVTPSCNRTVASRGVLKCADGTPFDVQLTTAGLDPSTITILVNGAVYFKPRTTIPPAMSAAQQQTLLNNGTVTWNLGEYFQDAAPRIILVQGRAIDGNYLVRSFAISP